tara:strand:- start:501 stop:2048 length:1548 start_codon:yes stop_codon:yes gene_type:complete
MKFLLIDDEIDWQDILQESLTKYLPREGDYVVEQFTMQKSVVADQLQKLQQPETYRDVSAVFIDLSLKSDGFGEKDFDFSTSEVLPRIRSAAPWVPCVCISLHFTNNLMEILKSSLVGFDALVPKVLLKGHEEGFAKPEFAKMKWTGVLNGAKVNRLSRLIGEDPVEIMKRCDADARPKLTFSGTIEEKIPDSDRGKLSDCLAIAGFDGQELLVLNVIDGFSGASVFKVCSSASPKSRGWLIKAGKNISRLEAEVQAHKLLFKENLSRMLSTPCMHNHVISKDGYGIIAYEFEGDMNTLHDSRECAAGLAKGNYDSVFEHFYADCNPHKVLILDSLAPKLTNLVSLPQEAKSVALDQIQRLLVKDGPLADITAVVPRGREHGDLHARNLLVSSRGMTFIDFAHFKSDGNPLFDFSKITAHLAVHRLGGFSLKGLLENPFGSPVNAMLKRFLGGLDVRQLEGLHWFCQASLLVHLTKYRHYQDDEISNETRSEIDEVVTQGVNEFFLRAMEIRGAN